MPNHPLAEVFGFPADNLTPEAERYRKNRLCPFHNNSPNCTKTSVENPLGVCSVFGSKGEAVITCPVRFRQDWLIATDAGLFVLHINGLLHPKEFRICAHAWLLLAMSSWSDMISDNRYRPFSLNKRGQSRILGKCQQEDAERISKVLLAE